VTAEFSKRLKAIREKRGFTQKQLGELTGIAQSRIASMETSSTTNPTLDTLIKLASALGCRVCDLTDG